MGIRGSNLGYTNYQDEFLRTRVQKLKPSSAAAVLASSRSLLKFRYAEPESTLDRRLPYNTEASTEWPQGSLESGIPG